jgi:long-chain acyl-CoA synthetase
MNTAPLSDTKAAVPAPAWPAMSIDAAHRLLTAPGAVYEIEEKTIHGLRQKVWKNAPPSMREIFLVGTTHGDKTFIVYEDERVSYAEFTRAALALAAAMQADGVVKGDRVVIAMRNLPEFPVALFATWLVGGIAVPLNAWWSGAELEYALRDSGACLAVVDAERMERLDAALTSCTDLRHVLVARAGAAWSSSTHAVSVRQLESVLGEVGTWSNLPPGVVPVIDLDPEDDATILYTSGTTGKPKGALGTHRNIVTTVATTAFGSHRAYLRRGVPIPTLEDRVSQMATLVGIPFFHVTGCHCILCPALLAGGKLVTMYRWDTERAMALIEREKVTHAGGVPTLAWQILEHPARDQYDLSSLESMSYGGAPAAAELVRRLDQVMPAAMPGTGWGMTETSATFTSHGAEDYQERPTSAGLALPICEMKIVGEQGEALAPGEVGELLAYGPIVVKGYWRKPEASRDTFVDGWVRTGDLAKIDADGFLYIVDRKKDMLIRGGENIYCVEVENALFEHPAVMDAGVIGLPHVQLGEEPAAVVTIKEGYTVSEEELRAFVRGKLASFKVPVRVVQLPTTLPRNANGKILKKELRPLFD